MSTFTLLKHLSRSVKRQSTSSQTLRLLTDCNKLFTTKKKSIANEFVQEKLFQVPIRFVGKASHLENDNETFSQIFKVGTADLRFMKAMKILSRYQIMAMSVLTPLALTTAINGSLSWVVGGGAATIGSLSVFACIYYLYTNRNCVYSLKISDSFTTLNIGYITPFGRGKEVFAPVTYRTFVDDPELIFDKKFAKLVFNSSREFYVLHFKGGVITDEKLFLQTFGPTILSDFKVKIST